MVQLVSKLVHQLVKKLVHQLVSKFVYQLVSKLVHLLVSKLVHQLVKVRAISDWGVLDTSLKEEEHSMCIPVPVVVQLEEREHLHMSVSQLRQELLRRTMYLHQSQEKLQGVREATSLRSESALLSELACTLCSEET